MEICLGGHRGEGTPPTPSQNAHKQIKEVLVLGGRREESKSGEKEGCKEEDVEGWRETGREENNEEQEVGRKGEWKSFMVLIADFLGVLVDKTHTDYLILLPVTPALSPHSSSVSISLLLRL